MRFLSRGLVHHVVRLWDIDGFVIFNCDSLDQLRTLGTLNVACACGERTLWMKGQGKAYTDKEPITCLACLVSPS